MGPADPEARAGGHGLHAVVLAGGDTPTRDVAAEVPPADLVVAADSGLHAAAELGLRADVVVGDLDSVDGSVLARAQAEGAEVVRHPSSKDATDLELALRLAFDRGARRISVVGGGGGRLDHLLAGLLVLALPDLAPARIEAHTAAARLLVVHRHGVLHERPGQLLTVVPVGGPARGVTLTGVRYPLRDEDLDPGSTRGVSNVVVDPTVTVALREGALLAVRPRHAHPVRTDELATSGAEA